MRKITEESVNAFVNSERFKKQNTEVLHHSVDKITYFYLHGNCIAIHYLDKNELFVSTCGWKSNTTKERLNGILRAFNLPIIYQKNFEWFFTDGESFDKQTRIFKEVF